MVTNLERDTILNGKYIIEDIIRITDTYVEYIATDLLIHEDVIIREFYLENACTRDLAQGDSIVVDEKCGVYFSQEKDVFRIQASNLANTSNGLVKNFFYENNTAYVVILNKKRIHHNTKKRKTFVLSVLLVIIVLVITVVILLIHRNNGQVKEEPSSSVIDRYVVLSEEELISRLEKSISGEIIETFYGDFNADGRTEMWATVWDDEGYPFCGNFHDYYISLLKYYSQVIDGAVEDDKCNIEAGRDYRQFQIWYIDENEASMVGDFTSIFLTEEMVNRTSPEWSRGWLEDTFYFIGEPLVYMVQFGKTQQLFVKASHYWMTPRGAVEVSYVQSCLYENAYGPRIRFDSEESEDEYEFKLRNEEMCVVKYPDYSAEKNYTKINEEIMFFPVYYIGGEYVELSSVEVDEEDIQSLPGYDKICSQAMDLDFNFFYRNNKNFINNYFYIDGIHFNQFLYNDNGYIFLNGEAKGELNECVYGETTKKPNSKMDVCLELRIEDGTITGYRWLGEHQQISFTNFEKIYSDANNLKALVRRNISN